MSMREVQPELLDQLPPGDPVAARIHRDILRYNRMQGNFEWIRRALSESLRDGDRVLEIAAGEGRLLSALAQSAELGLGVPAGSGLPGPAGRDAGNAGPQPGSPPCGRPAHAGRARDAELGLGVPTGSGLPGPAGRGAGNAGPKPGSPSRGRPAHAGLAHDAELGLGVPTKPGLLARASRVAAFDAICPRPENCPEQVEWTVCRAEDFADYGAFDVILVCHFLHQLPEETLRQLGRQLAGARLILAAETRRHPLAAGLCRASRLIGFSAEGIGDGLKSIRAGFRGGELKELLELDEARWRVKLTETLLGSYRLIAEKPGQP